MPDLKKLMTDGRLRKLIILCGALGIGLILLSSLTDFSDNDNTAINYNVSEYCEDVRLSLKNILENMDGVGECEVLLTVENSVEGVYLENNQTKTKEIEPKIRGVVVACEGGDDAVVEERVTQAVTKAFDISTAKVFVTKLKE